MGKELNFREKLLIKADVALSLRRCQHRKEKMLCAYKYLNVLSDDEEKEIYIEAIKENMSELDFQRVMAETSYSHFDNTSLWVEYTVMEIIDYYVVNKRGKHDKSIEDVIKGAFCIFIEEYISFLSKKVADELLDAVLKDPMLEFLHPVAFYEKNNLKDFIENNNMSEDEKYLELLEFNFEPFDFIKDIQNDSKAKRRENALLRRQEKRKEKKYDNIMSYQLSFKHLLFNEK